MKKTFLYVIAAALTAVSCNEVRIDGPIGYGELVLALTGDPAVDIITKSELSEAQAAEYYVWVCDESGKLIVNKDRFSSSISVPAGPCKVWAESCTETEAEKDQGCVRYLGNSGEVEVTAGGSTEVDINCYVANALVEVIFDQSVKGKFKDDELSVTLNREGSETVQERRHTVYGTYDQNATEGIKVWFNAGSTVTYLVSGTLDADGSTVSGEGSLNGIKEKSHTKLMIKFTSEGQLTLTSEVQTEINTGEIDAGFNPYLNEEN